jgi:hypothetical protein
MGRLAAGVRADDQPEWSADLQAQLEHLKGTLLHGKVSRALEVIDELGYALDVVDARPAHPKLPKAVRAFETYVTHNRAFIPNDGERYRQGKIIAPGFVESAVNQVVSKRFVKKQQMRWSEAGAHRLLQIRTQVLNQTWCGTLSRWYPGLKQTPCMKAV